MKPPRTLYAEKAGTYLNPATALYGHPTRRWMSDHVMTAFRVLEESEVLTDTFGRPQYVVTWARAISNSNQTKAA